jgi:hypothetical protein
MEEQVRDKKLVMQQVLTRDLSSISRCDDRRAGRKVEIINKKDVAQQEKIKELKVLIVEKLIRFSMPTFIVLVALVVVLTCMFLKF